MLRPVATGQSVFTAGLMIAFDHVALPVSGLIAVEVVVGFISAPRKRSAVAVTRVKPVVDMAGEVFGAVEPGASSQKYTTNKPVGPVVAVRRAVVGRIREVAIGSDGRHSDGDGDLR